MGVAHSRGFFKEEGFDSEVIRMNPNVATTAAVTGDIDFSALIGSLIESPSELMLYYVSLSVTCASSVIQTWQVGIREKRLRCISSETGSILRAQQLTAKH